MSSSSRRPSSSSSGAAFVRGRSRGRRSISGRQRTRSRRTATARGTCPSWWSSPGCRGRAPSSRATAMGSWATSGSLRGTSARWGGRVVPVSGRILGRPGRGLRRPRLPGPRADRAQDDVHSLPDDGKPSAAGGPVPAQGDQDTDGAGPGRLVAIERLEPDRDRGVREPAPDLPWHPKCRTGLWGEIGFRLVDRHPHPDLQDRT